MSVGRIHRLLRLIILLQSGRARSSRDVQVELGVSRRTLFRDLEALQQAGVPCYHDPESGYRIARTFFLPPLGLSVQETLGLMLLGKAAGALHESPMVDAALGAINKLTSTVSDPIRTACSDVMANVSFDLGACGTTEVRELETRYYPTLQRCLDERRACKVIYRDPAERRNVTCVLHPYVLHYAVRAWYVMGAIDRRRGVQILKLARIRALEPLQKHFVRPQQFRTADKLGQAWLLEREGKIYKVELEFAPEVGGSVAEVRWHASQTQQFLPDGRCRMTFEVDGLAEIAQWVCSYGDRVIVLKPSALKNLVQATLRAALHRYANDERDFS